MATGFSYYVSRCHYHRTANQDRTYFYRGPASGRREETNLDPVYGLETDSTDSLSIKTYQAPTYPFHGLGYTCSEVHEPTIYPTEAGLPTLFATVLSTAEFPRTNSADEYKEGRNLGAQSVTESSYKETQTPGWTTSTEEELYEDNPRLGPIKVTLTEPHISYRERLIDE